MFTFRMTATLEYCAPSVLSQELYLLCTNAFQIYSSMFIATAQFNDCLCLEQLPKLHNEIAENEGADVLPEVLQSSVD